MVKIWILIKLRVNNYKNKKATKTKLWDAYVPSTIYDYVFYENKKATKTKLRTANTSSNQIQISKNIDEIYVLDLSSYKEFRAQKIEMQKTITKEIKKQKKKTKKKKMRKKFPLKKNKK